MSPGKRKKADKASWGLDTTDPPAYRTVAGKGRLEKAPQRFDEQSHSVSAKRGRESCRVSKEWVVGATGVRK